MRTGRITVDKKRYYCAADGAMLTGWQQIDSKWYYFNSDGSMKTGWLYSGSKWFYLSPASSTYGQMQIGARVIGGKRYYFDATTGAMLAASWKQLAGNWYYFQSDGSAAVSTTLTIDSVVYTFDQYGRSDKAPT